MYINETIPRSNKEAHPHYYLILEGEGIKRAETLQDTEHIAEMAANTHKYIKKAVRVQYGIAEEFIPETHRERFDREEGRDRCARIAREIEAYADGNIYRCPECGKVFEMPDDDGEKYRCTQCHETFDRDDAEQLGIYDYMEDAIDIEYRCDGNKEYKSCKICIGYGGPNIYIDTADRSIKLYWGYTRESWGLYPSTVDAIDEWANEYFECL